MKPFLHRGKPVGQHLRKSGSNNDPIYLCTCEVCSLNGSLVVMANGNQMYGQYFYSDYAVKEHQRELADFERLAEQMGSNCDSDGPLLSRSAAIPISSVLDSAIPLVSMTMKTYGTSESIPRASSVLPASSGSTSCNDIDDENAGAKAPHEENIDISFEWANVFAIRGQLERAKVQYGWDPSELEFLDDVSSLPLAEDIDPQSLLSDSLANSHLRGHLEWLAERKSFLNGLSPNLRVFTEVRFRLELKVAKRMLDEELEETAKRVKDEMQRRKQVFLSGQERIVASKFSQGDYDDLHRRAYFVVLLVAGVLHLACNLSFMSMAFFLGSMRIVSGLQTNDGLSHIHNEIPADMRTVALRLELYPKYTMFVCCPKCFSLYPIENSPERCPNRSAPESSACGRLLLRDVRYAQDVPANSQQSSNKRAPKSMRPVRTFCYQDLKQWIAWMHSRADLEHYMERPWKVDPPKDGKVTDVWDADFLRQFLGPDGKNLFMSPDRQNENRLLFNLNADGFNPYGNRISGKKVSIGGIYLQCLNLPPQLRNKAENMFLVGIIPGPKEPSFHQINYILRPLVNDLRTLWTSGIFLSRTHLHPHGRSVRAALVALVCDLPAARLLGGFSHYRSGTLPCSICKASELNELDESSFTYRSAEEHRQMANSWLQAQTEKERSQLYIKNGVRWSVLLELDYWDPVQNTVIDPMHGFYLGLFQRHCRKVWGMKADVEDVNGLWEKDPPTPEQKARAERVFKNGSASSLGDLPNDLLEYLCLRENLEHRRGRKTLLGQLLRLRIEKGWFDQAQKKLDINFGTREKEAGAPGRDNDKHQPSRTLERKPVSASLQPDGDLSGPDAEHELQLARHEYIHGKTKQALKKFTISILQQLAREHNIEVRTEKGRESNSLELTVKALVDKRNETRNVSSITTQLPFSSGRPDDPLPPAPTSTQAHVPNVTHFTPSLASTSLRLQDEEKVQHMVMTSSRSALNKLGLLKIRVASIFMAQLAEIRAKSAREAGGTQKIQPPPLDVPFPQAKKEKEAYKQDLQTYIHRARVAHGIIDEEGRVLKKKTRRRKGKKTLESEAVLGKQTLTEIRHDMARLSLPTWVAKAPARPGEKDQGKLTADQWRSFCTINLPFTLTRLWGSLPEDNRFHQMLVNFMQLVTAVRIANMRSLTESSICQFEENIRAYLKGLLELYPHTHLTAYQHMMLHFGDLLRRFGPVHSWRCFPFERLNYILQKTPNNSILGELETTLFNRFCMTQRLNALFQSEGLPGYLQSLGDLYQKYIKRSDSRGTRISDDLAFDESVTSQLDDIDWYGRGCTRLSQARFRSLQQLIQDFYDASGKLFPSVQAFERFRYRDLTFTTQKHSFSDAQVVINLRNRPGHWSAGSITSLFAARWEDKDNTRMSRMFAEVELYKDLSSSEARLDPYRSFDFGGRLYHRSKTATVLLPVELIDCHFAFSRDVGLSVNQDEAVWALPLNKVRNDLFTTPARLNKCQTLLL